MKSRAASLLGSAVFLVIAPGSIAGLIPWWMTRWRAGPPFFGSPIFPIIGVAFIAFGALVLLESFVRFAWNFGTPAPIAPTRHLVVSGFYRHVRNPMYVAVSALIFGQALLFGSAALLAYGALIWLAFHIFVLAYEEPTLRRSYGDEYAVYARNVPRWIPRLRPWRLSPTSESSSAADSAAR